MSAQALLLRRNDPAQRMPPRQHNAPMIHLGRRSRHLLRLGPLRQRPAARRAPVRRRLLSQHRMTLTANPFHTSKSYRIAPGGWPACRGSKVIAPIKSGCPRSLAFGDLGDCEPQLDHSRISEDPGVNFQSSGQGRPIPSGICYLRCVSLRPEYRGVQGLCHLLQPNS